MYNAIIHCFRDLYKGVHCIGNHYTECLILDSMMPSNMVEFHALWRDSRFSDSLEEGGMAERSKAPVLKTGMVKAIVGSNPSPSALDFRLVQFKI